MKCTVFPGAVVALASLSVFAGIGPMDNPDDQYRFIWDCADDRVPDVAAAGFNAVINGSGLYWNLTKGEPPAKLDERIESFRKRLDTYQALGVGFIQRFRYGYDKDSVAKYPRIDKDGKADDKHVDAANAAYQASVRKAVAAEVKLTGTHPALIGTLMESETRGHLRPSFTPEMAAAYRAYSGHDVPEQTAGRNPVPWQKIAGFPKDGVVPDDWPLLDFYRWQWRSGDGWTDYLDLVAETFAANCDHPVMSMYDPTLRCLSQWGNIGGKVSHLNHWTYVYPEPYRIAYNIAELQAAARGFPGQQVLAMIQAISYRSVIAPLKEHPANEPAWAKEVPNAGYPTTPPDVVQEAMWHVFARKTDGIGFHGWNALYDDGKRATTKSYALTNPETAKRIGKLFAEVGIPYGPLLRAIPEREPVVAVLESCAAQVLGARISYGVHNYFSDGMFLADAANLSPYVMYEDEVKKCGIPSTVKVIILPKCDVLTKTTCEALKRFQANGGRIVADDMLLSALKADATFVSVQEEAKNTVGDFDDGIVRKTQDAEVRDRAVWKAAKKLREAVALPAYADADEEHILVHARSAGTADYVFAINSKRTLGDYVGPWRRLLEKGLPNAGNVIVRREAGAVYDLVKHTAVPFTVKDGVTTIPVSYDTNDGRAFVVTDRPLATLTWKMDGTILTVSSSDRGVMVPIRVDGFSPKPFYAVVKAGEWKHDFGVAPKTFAVTNLVDGKLAEKHSSWWPFW